MILYPADGLPFQFPGIHRAVFKIEYTARTNGGANATTHTGSTNNVLSALRIGLHINSHLAIGAAIAAADALASIGCDAEA